MKEPYLTELPGFIDLDYMKGIADNMLTDEWKSLSDVEALAIYTDCLLYTSPSPRDA